MIPYSIRIKVLDVLEPNPEGAALWFKVRNYITKYDYDYICMNPTMSSVKADKLVTILLKSSDGLKSLICYLRVQKCANLADEIKDEISLQQLPKHTTKYNDAANDFISDLKQFTRRSCEVIRQHWKDNLQVDDLENAYVPLTMANEKELSPKYKWNHDDLQNLAFLYVDEVRIFITGEPGFGKSTLLNKIAYDWATGNNPALAEHFDFVYYLPLSEGTGNSLSEAILAYLAFDDKETASTIISRCFADESYRSRTLFLLDAYDEANLTSFPALSRIVEGRENCLNKCVITSRPLQVADFQKPIHISARGFNDDAQADYIKKHVHDVGRRAHILGQSLEFFNSPFFLTVVCLLANHNKTFNFQGPSALFELLQEYHRWLYENAMQNKKMQVRMEDYNLALIEAGKFALQEMLQSCGQKTVKRLVKHLKVSVGSRNDHALLKRAAQLGVMTAKTVRGAAHLRSPDSIMFSFLHKILAEYLCAVHLNHLIRLRKASWWHWVTSTGVDTKVLVKLLLGDYRHFGMVSFFLSGLSKDYFHAVVQHVFRCNKNDIPRLCDSFWPRRGQFGAPRSEILVEIAKICKEKNQLVEAEKHYVARLKIV